MFQMPCAERDLQVFHKPLKARAAPAGRDFRMIMRTAAARAGCAGKLHGGAALFLGTRL